MSLVDDYLRAVAILLPRAKRNDIVEELRELIHDKIEAREGEVGRILTDDETDAVLRGIGHPLVVAGRYHDGPQHVVGPALYPYWVFALKVSVTVQLCLAALLFLIRALEGDVAEALGRAMSSAITGAVMLVGLITIAAWLIERRFVNVDHLDRWRVKDLRFLEVVAWGSDTWAGLRPRNFQATSNGPKPWPDVPEGATTTGSGSDLRREAWVLKRTARRETAWRDRYRWSLASWSRSARYEHHQRSRGVGMLIGGSLLLLWWSGLIRFGLVGSGDDLRALGVDPAGFESVDWVALKATLFWPVIGYLGLVAGLGAVLFLHPDASRVHGLLNITIGAAVILLSGWLVTDSAISPVLKADTLAGMIRRIVEDWSHAPPFGLAGVILTVLACLVFGGVLRLGRGLWELLAPIPLLHHEWEPAQPH